MAARSGANLENVLARLKMMRQRKIWPNGARYLFTDAYGVILLITLYYETKDEDYLKQAEELIAEVYRVLGCPKGLRIGNEICKDAQYFHYLTRWMYALNQMGRFKPEYHTKAVQLAKDVHSCFTIPGKGVNWKCVADLSGPYPEFGFSGHDHYDGYVHYKLLDPVALSHEIGEMHEILQKDIKIYYCTQEITMGECLWFTHFFPDEDWAIHMRKLCNEKLQSMWYTEGDDKGYFSRGPDYSRMQFAFTNFAFSYAISAVNMWPDRVDKLNNYFENYTSNDIWDDSNIAHILHCSSLLPGVLMKDYLANKG